MTEISVPYGATDVFFTVSANEVLFLKDYRRPQIEESLRNEMPKLLESGQKIGIDAKILLDLALRELLNSAIRALADDGVERKYNAIGPRALLSLPDLHVDEMIRQTLMDHRDSNKNPDVIFGLFSSYVFLDLLRLLVPLLPIDQEDFPDCINTYIEEDEFEAIRALLDELMSHQGRLPSIVAIRDRGGSLEHKVLTDKNSVIATLSSWKMGSILELPSETNSFFGSLGGQPHDLVPSLSIPYMMEIVKRLDLEAIGFAAIWKYSSVDIPFFLSAISRQSVRKSKMASEFRWESITLHLLSQMKFKTRVRLLTSLHPALVEKILGWRATLTATDAISSLKRITGSRFKLSVIGDVTNNVPSIPRVS